MFNSTPATSPGLEGLQVKLNFEPTEMEPEIFLLLLILLNKGYERCGNYFVDYQEDEPFPGNLIDLSQII
jgi:hypothetical protein